MVGIVVGAEVVVGVGVVGVVVGVVVVVGGVGAEVGVVVEVVVEVIHAAAQLTAVDWRKTCAHHPTRYIGQVPSASFLGRYWREELYPHERAAIGDVEEFRVQVIQALRRKA